MRPPTDAREAVARLAADGLIEPRGDRHRTTRRWQAAMSRAAWKLLCTGEDGCEGDLRAPIALAVLEIYGDAIPDEELACRIEAMTPIEAHELDPCGRAGASEGGETAAR